MDAPVLSSMFAGADTGQIDDNGVVIRCGDRIRWTESKPAHWVRWTEDGWGRDVPLGRSDQHQVPAKTTVSHGVVSYSPEKARFIVVWEDRWPDTEDLSITFGASQASGQGYAWTREVLASRTA